MRYKVTVAYDGSNYHGWAKQENYCTIQQTIENALLTFYKVPITIYGSGRTDAGVHAYAQVFHFDDPTNNKIKLMFLQIALNNLLPRDIKINKIVKTDNKFNARFNAKSKTYEYVINCGKYNVFNQSLQYQYNKNLNLQLIKKAAKLFEGKHDFLSFCTEQKNDNVRTISQISVTKKDDLIFIKVIGNGFLRNMIRMITGSLLAINEYKIDLKNISFNLDNPAKGQAIYKAPSCGLYLKEVKY